MPTTTQLDTLNINRLTKAQYDAIENINPTDLYYVIDDLGITYADLIQILGYVPQAQFDRIDCGTSTTVI